MKVYHWVSKHLNFGDDLNQFLWSFLMPEVVAEDDGAVLVGVGTVLSDELPAGKPRVVMGSGVGYKPAPVNIHGPDWKVYAVRGPLTSRLLGLPAETAVVDPAVMLTHMPDFRSGAAAGPIFIPHWETAHLEVWRDAAAAAGLRFVDPRQEAHVVIQEIAGASLVIAESMHAAIISDAFRIPWVPIIGTHRSMFKWKDWAASLGVDYKPLHIGLFAKLQAQIAPHAQFTGKTRGGADRSSERVPRIKPASVIRQAVNSIPDAVQRSLIARGLAAAKSHSPWISDDKQLEAKQTILLNRIEQLREDYAAGRIVQRPSE